MERLLNHCLISGPCTSQVMGRVIFDFGMFFPEPKELGRCETWPSLEAIEMFVLVSRGVCFLFKHLANCNLISTHFETFKCVPGKEGAVPVAPAD